MSLTNTEFFVYECEVWYRASDGTVRQLEEADGGMIDELIDHVSTYYPAAYAALCDEYKGCSLNRRYYRYRIALRFIRCNFAQLDSIPDFTDHCRCTFESVPCPLRGECRHDRVICKPVFDHRLSASELPVLRLWYNGESIDEIATQLHLSPHTVNNHIRHAYQRLGIHTRGEFAKFAAQNNLFS